MREETRWWAVDPGMIVSALGPNGRQVMDELEPAIEATLAGAEGAWERLAVALHAEVLAICRRRRYGAGSPSVADVHRELAVRALERLRADDHAALRAWAAARARYPAAGFGAWLGTVVAHLFVDHQRGGPERVRRRRDGGRVLEAVTTVELAADGAVAAGDPALAAEVLRIARALCAPDFPADQRQAVALWLRGEPAEVIAAELGLADAAAAHRLLHAARERLRRRFHHQEERS